MTNISVYVVPNEKEGWTSTASTPTQVLIYNNVRSPGCEDETKSREKTNVWSICSAKHNSPSMTFWEIKAQFWQQWNESYSCSFSYFLHWCLLKCWFKVKKFIKWWFLGREKFHQRRKKSITYYVKIVFFQMCLWRFVPFFIKISPSSFLLSWWI